MSNKEIIQETISQYWNVLDCYKGKSLEELRDICSADRLPYAVCAINVTGDLNLGMMLRAACLLGAEKFIIYGRRKFDRRSTVGADNYIDIVRIQATKSQYDSDTDYSLFHPTMKELGYTPIFLETDGTPIDRFPRNIIKECRPCLVFGNEGLGIPKEITDGHFVVSIPQRGVLRSLNVSSAASIAMYEVMKCFD